MIERDVDLFAYRDGDGAWKPFEVDGAGRAELRITEGRYSLAWVCDDEFWTRAFVLHSTLDDEPRAHCFGQSSGGVLLYGQTAPGTTIYAGGSQSSADDLGNYTAFVSPPGYHDIVLVTSEPAPRVVIERDVDLRGDRKLDVPFDDRAANVETSVPVIYGPPQDVSLTSELHTTNGDHVVFPSSGEVVRVVPASLLLDTDWQVVRAQGTACENVVRVRGGTPTLELPEEPITMLDRSRLTWGSELEWSRVLLDVSRTNGAYSIATTRDWIDEADSGGVEIPDLTQLPGWRSSWGTVGTIALSDYSVTFETGSRASSYTSCTVSDGASF